MTRMSSGLNQHRRTLAVICLAWTLGIVVLHLWGESNYTRAEWAVRDHLMTNSLARTSPQHPDLVYLGIDEAAKTLDSVFADDIEQSRGLQLMKQQSYPWNREVYGLMIDRLAKAGAKAIVLDVLFPQPSPNDAPFRAALERWSDRVVIGTNFTESAGDHKSAHILPTHALCPPPGKNWLGFVNVRPDDDQIVRHVRYRTSALEYAGIEVADGEELLSLSGRALEKAGYGARIPQTHAPVAIRYCPEIQPLSVHEIFVEAQWAAPPYEGGKLFRDKIVLIGASGNIGMTGQTSDDRLNTPFGVMLGPKIHLSAINAALNRDLIRETSPLANVSLILLAGLLAWLLGARVASRNLRLLLLALLLAGYYGGAQLLYNSAGLLPILLGPMLVLGGSAMTWTVFEQARDVREQQRVRRTLERYVSRDAVREILDNPASFLNSLGGERRSISVLFSDIRSFTTMTESADPHALVAQLNEYFDEMVGIVFAHEGTLDKFIGDAVMAHWGSIATAGPETDARRAVTTALEMRAALARLNTGWQARGLRQLAVGFGINHGDAIVGNLGCAAKMEVSVLGDAVNLGSRLEGVTKEYGIDLCLGESLAPLVRDAFILRSVDLILVKGKTQPIEVFTALAPRPPGTAEPAWLARHEEAVRAYRRGDFDTAEAAWLDVLAAEPGDALASIFFARCAALRENPPPGEWTGVFTMSGK
ncbi:MAG: adenylate/guanylate cyclase domain-containing protein [Chthoniobacter sp.]|nr:adenylate/guanylate cyclase domain-containing protein [Chthoniobacter sp.]